MKKGINYKTNPVGFIGGIYKQIMAFIEEYPSMSRKKIDDTKKKLSADINKIKNSKTKEDVLNYYREVMGKLAEE